MIGGSSASSLLLSDMTAPMAIPSRGGEHPGDDPRTA
jgi:hypothetical protein